jgi:hypothetical protein
VARPQTAGLPPARSAARRAGKARKKTVAGIGRRR